MKKQLSTIFAALAIAATATATAEPFAHGVITVNSGYGWQQGGFRGQPLAGLREINMRQQTQRNHIEHGFNNGLITRFEFRRLMAEQQSIQATERAYVADGFLAPAERMDLNRRLDFAQQHIAFEARDNQRRF